jgi:hypothetical protein
MDPATLGWTLVAIGLIALGFIVGTDYGMWTHKKKLAREGKFERRRGERRKLQQGEIK